jgi:hypothetical protein
MTYELSSDPISPCQDSLPRALQHFRLVLPLGIHPDFRLIFPGHRPGMCDLALDRPTASPMPAGACENPSARRCSKPLDSRGSAWASRRVQNQMSIRQFYDFTGIMERSRSSQLIEQRLGALQTGGVKALGEPAVNRREQTESFRPPALFTP